MNEYTYATERQAHDERRKHINTGRSVSLVAFDPGRNAYVFDVSR